MKYLWIGVGNSSSGEKEIISNGGKIMSAAVSSSAILNGIEQCGVSCDSINAGLIPVYPRYKKMFVHRDTWSRTGVSRDISVGYLNLKYIALLSKKRALVKEAKHWAKQNRHEGVTVFVYQMHSPFMAAACAVKKIIPEAKIVLIVPDLPQYMDMGMNRLKAFLKKIDWQSIKRYMRKVDQYILYSKHMADFLKLREGSWLVMEGSFDPTLLVEEAAQKDPNITSIMYSGVLDLRYGIKELLEAMAYLDETCELWLTGSGNAVPLIKEYAQKDSRIRFFGYLPSRKDLLIKQKQATMLISTRNPGEPASAYCFPSKIFEYMISGNPVISTRIKGIPEAYFDHLIPLEMISPEQIAACIEKVRTMTPSERQAFGYAARSFILENKNNHLQAKRIVDFVR